MDKYNQGYQDMDKYNLERRILSAIMNFKEADCVVPALRNYKFTCVVHQKIYDAMTRCKEKGYSIDLVTVTNEIKEVESPLERGWHEPFVDVLTVVSSPATVQNDVDELLKKHVE